MTGGCLEPKSAQRTRTKCLATGWRIFSLNEFVVVAKSMIVGWLWDAPTRTYVRHAFCYQRMPCL